MPDTTWSSSFPSLGCTLESPQTPRCCLEFYLFFSFTYSLCSSHRHLEPCIPLQHPSFPCTFPCPFPKQKTKTYSKGPYPILVLPGYQTKPHFHQQSTTPSEEENTWKGLDPRKKIAAPLVLLIGAFVAITLIYANLPNL